MGAPEKVDQSRPWSREEFEKNPHVDLAVVCCPWPQYRDLAPRNGTRVFSPWQL